MADVDALLDEALQELDTRTYLTIDPVTRVVNTNGKLLLGVESDEGSNRVWFKCPRIVGDNFDLTTGHIRVNYENANKFRNSYLVEDVTVDGDNVIFSWKLFREVTIFKGTVKFIVCVKKADSEGVLQNEWNTTLATGDVLEGLETTQQIVEENYDILEQILIKVDELNVSIEDAVNKYLDENPVQAYDLPIATPTTLGGVKPIAKTDEMTQEVGVDELGGLFTKEGGSGVDGWKLVNTITLEQDVTSVWIENSDGSDLNAYEVLITIENPNPGANCDCYMIVEGTNGNLGQRAISRFCNNGALSKAIIEINRVNGLIKVSHVKGQSGHYSEQSNAWASLEKDIGLIRGITLRCSGGTHIMTGAVFNVYVRG